MKALSGPILIAFCGVVLLAQSSQTIEQRVRALYDAGQWAEAARVAAASPVQSASIVLYRGLALARLNELVQAANLFQEAAKRFPDDKRFPLESAGVAYREKQYGTAKKYLHRALRLDATDNYGNDFLASLYLLDGNLTAALKYWNRIGKPLIRIVEFEPDPPLDPVLRERTFDISGGQIFTLERLRVTEANLNRLDAIAQTDFDLTPTQDGTRESHDPDQRFNLAIRTVPVAQPFAGWFGRLLPIARGLPYETVDLDFYNLERRALNFTSLWRWDPEKRRIFLNLSGPLRMNPRFNDAYFLDARDEIWDLRQTYRGVPGGFNGLILRKAEAGADFKAGLTSKLQWTLGAQLAWRQFRNVPASSFFSDGWTAELRNRFDYLLWSWPDHRVRVNSWALLRSGRVFTAFPSRLISGDIGLNGVWFPQARGDTYSVIFQADTGKTWGNVPLDDLFMLGMERDNPFDLWFRGYVGTRNGRKGSAPMGREYALSQTDLDRKLFEFPFVRFYAGPFFDSGWTGDSSGQFGSRQWLYATGIEGKVATIGAVKLRLVYGHDLRAGRNVFYTAVSR